MTTHDSFDLSADLPPHHESEPASLRQDILDELADHLACSLRREAVLTPDENQARRNVLQRFGNPAGIARKLWRDAMWEKIMLQRLSLGLSLVSMVAIVVVGLVLWRMVEQSNASQAALLSQQEILSQLGRSQADMADRQREFAAAMLAALKSQSQPTVPHENWIPLEIKLISENGSPVKGTVHIETVDGQSAIPPVNMSLETNSRGISALGQLAFGKYNLTVELADLPLRTNLGLFLRPGEESKIEFVCPESIPEAEVRFDVHPPEDFVQDEINYVVEIGEGVQFHGRQWWTTGQQRPTAVLDSRGNFFGQVTNVIRLASSDQRFDPRSIRNPENFDLPITAESDFLQLIGLRLVASQTGSQRRTGIASLLFRQGADASFYTSTPLKIRGNIISAKFNVELFSRRHQEKDLPQWLRKPNSTDGCLVADSSGEVSFWVTTSSVDSGTERVINLQLGSDHSEWRSVAQRMKTENARLLKMGFERIPVGEGASKDAEPEVIPVEPKLSSE